MLKSVCLAAGLFSCLVGAELLVVESASIKPINGSGPVREITAPDWAPWAVISGGAVTILHFCSAAGGAFGGGSKSAAGKLPQG